MPAPEPDLDAILPLLDPAAFARPRRNWKAAYPDWAPARDAAIVALCWLVGLKPLQLGHMLRRDWRRGDVARLPGLGRYAGIRGREMPVLDAAREVVGLYLKTCPLPMPPGGPLLLRADGTAFGERDVSPFNARLKKVTGGRIPALAHLTGRFERYVEWSARQDGTVERLAGRVGPDDDKDPAIGRLRRALREAHPLGRGLPGAGKH
ncbi:hypothetical protein GJ654_20340 [Rhodoblastus acidophilus]|uniref:Tyr recombinase domain-containing protein n=1 Tax=Rhodoblastus acidophilus TaxID=1074 RepID=A0A6N8DS93_RHOAC|nr:hypothetical protein [Rhodoblastus acidophilus]MCW2276534.1 integrase [Rhodoblastus acidophilus]MTV33329.1 hypothetical protein [Rhodoblastus acidophilus]